MESRTPSTLPVAPHAGSVEEVLTEVGSDRARGLSHADAAQRLRERGPNRLTHVGAESRWRMLLSQINQPLVLILLGAAAITLVIGEYIDSSVIFGVVVVNATIGYVQESKARRAIEALAAEMVGNTIVVRDGERHLIPTEQVVPGDLLILAAGDRVPADARLIDTNQCRIDESALTGESVPAGKSARVLPADTPLPDRCNMAHAITLVTSGGATAVVVATGDDSEIGKINTMIATADVLDTPLTRKIATFSTWLLWVILALAGATMVVGMIRGDSFLDMFLAAVALAVGAIPEGLPAAMTITLAIGVHRMAQRNAIIRHLPAVETLGSTTVICSDKTGTLTQNEMTVQRMSVAGRSYVVTGTGYDPDGSIQDDSGNPVSPLPEAVRTMLLTGLLCNDAHLFEEEGQWRITGDPTEGALLTAAAKGGLAAGSDDAAHPRLATLPFESQHQYMATLHQQGSGTVALVKGSVERVLAACADRWVAPGEHAELDPAQVHAAAEAMAADGLRVLAFALRRFPADKDDLAHAEISGLSFLGLQGMMDPPRAQSAASVLACRTAGIDVKMITGDHRVTAGAIAAEVGLLADSGHGRVVEGIELAATDDSDLVRIADRGTVFARVAPDQKLRLVKALQSGGNIVAMTGDGVNDAPALKQADIGVAMGRSGTEVAKESSDMVLTDDDFSTIAAAVEEGRAVFDNLVKFITWTLPTNLGEGLVILVAVMAGITLPITPVQILWINMTTAVLLGLTLAFERKEPDIMTRDPRPPDAPVLTGELLRRIVLVGFLLLVTSFGIFQLQVSAGVPLAEARTAAANMFVVGELFFLFNCRSLRLPMWRLGWFSNRILLIGVGLMIVLQLLFTYSPTMQLLFDTAGLDAAQWALILAGGLAIYTIVGVEKWWLARRESHAVGRRARPAN